MKIIVLGSAGMAGHIITKYLKLQNFDVITVAKSDADYLLNVENILEVHSFFDNMPDCDFVINCIGLLVKDSIDNPARADVINSWFPLFVEHKLKDKPTKLIHLSTDCVFDGATGNYIETATHTEVNAYGLSKSHGEINNTKDITFRTSIIGPELKISGTGLFNWIVNTTDKTINGWDNVLWNGITTLQLAKCIVQYIQNPSISGVYHLVSNNDNIDKYNLLIKINKIFHLKKNIVQTSHIKSINKILVNTRTDFNFDIADYDTQLKELRKFIND